MLKICSLFLLLPLHCPEWMCCCCYASDTLIMNRFRCKVGAIEFGWIAFERDERNKSIPLLFKYWNDWAEVPLVFVLCIELFTSCVNHSIAICSWINVSAIFSVSRSISVISTLSKQQHNIDACSGMNGGLLWICFFYCVKVASDLCLGITNERPSNGTST